MQWLAEIPPKFKSHKSNEQFILSMVHLSNPGPQTTIVTMEI